MFLKGYDPTDPQRAFHYAAEYLYRYTLFIDGVRGGKTYAGARQTTKDAWNAKGKGVFGIIAPTYNMLERTTWLEFEEAAAPFIAHSNRTSMIAVLKNGRRVHGHTAERPDRIRNETFVGAWCDEAREFKDFGMVWRILLARVLSTRGRIYVTTTPNSYDDIHDIFIEKKRPGYGIVRATTYDNTKLDRDQIDDLAGNYDAKFAQQELEGKFVTFSGQVYYTFDRKLNAGDYAMKMAQYDPTLPIRLMCDFNVDPMAWVLCQFKEGNSGLAEAFAIDEIFARNTDTAECCGEFKRRYPDHKSGLILYGDATGASRTAASNKTNWAIVKEELGAYGIDARVRSSNPAERDRVNSVNAMVCNSKGVRRFHVNPHRCRNLIRDLEQVSWKEGVVQIDKKKNLMLTHPSDAVGYGLEKEFPVMRARIEGLKI